MKRKRSIIALILAVALVFGSGGYASARPDDNAANSGNIEPSAAAGEMTAGAEYADDRVIVVYDSDVADRSIEKAVERQDGEVAETTELTADSSMAMVEISPDDSVEEAITRLESEAKIDYVQPNYIYEPAAEDPKNNNKPDNQWYLNNLENNLTGGIKARAAWKDLKNMDYSKVKVAVIDTGVDIKHEDLQNNLNKQLSRKIDGMHEPSLLTKDSETHGTHVSGIIAATYDNGKGVAGVSSGTGNDLVDLMVIDATVDQYFETYSLAAAITYAGENGARVCNMSLTGYKRDRVVEEVISEQTNKPNGMLCVAAAGNNSYGGTDAEVNPSDVGEVLSVCNTKQDDTLSDTSNYGLAKDISAPGTRIISTIPGNRYTLYTGTSMSSPMVAAAAAMVYAVNGSLTPYQVKNILCATTRPFTDSDSKNYHGYGIVDIQAAVNAAEDARTDIPATGVSIKEKEESIEGEFDIEMSNGDNHMLETLVTPATSLTEITWTSEDTDIATVDDYGRVTAQSTGSTKITAKAGDYEGAPEASCIVKVKDDTKPETISIVPIRSGEMENVIEVGGQYWLEAEITPAEAADSDVIWRSSDNSRAAVSYLGDLVGVKAGNEPVEITAETYNGIKSNPIEVYVSPCVETITLSGSIFNSGKIKLGTKNAAMKATPLPEKAINKTVHWFSSDDSVLEVDYKTGVLTPVAPGKAIIEAYTANWVSKTKKITVYRTNYKAGDYKLKAASNSYNSIKLSWRGFLNADGYVIQRAASKNGSYSTIKTLAGSARSYIDKKKTPGKKYYYRIRAFYNDNGRKYCDNYSYKVAAKAVPEKTKLVSRAGNRKIILNWKKVSGASGYAIYKASAKDGKYKWIARVSKSKLTYTHKNLKKGKTYYYRVKAYRLVNGKKVYGPFSNYAYRRL